MVLADSKSLQDCLARWFLILQSQMFTVNPGDTTAAVTRLLCMHGCMRSDHLLHWVSQTKKIVEKTYGVYMMYVRGYQCHLCTNSPTRIVNTIKWVLLKEIIINKKNIMKRVVPLSYHIIISLRFNITFMSWRHTLDRSWLAKSVYNPIYVTRRRYK